MGKQKSAGPGRHPGEPEEFDINRMEKETQEMLRTRFLDSSNAVFARTKGGFLSLQLEDCYYPRIQVVRCFPFREPERYLSIRTPQERSMEIGIIRDLKDVDKRTQDMLREQLTLRYFTPVISKIISIKDEFGYSYWEVLTDHGACRFTVRMGGNSIVHLSKTRILVLDVDENRFEISDLERLTDAERKKLDLFL